MQPSKFPVLSKKLLKLFKTTSVISPSKHFCLLLSPSKDRYLKNSSKKLLTCYRDLFFQQIFCERLLLSKQACFHSEKLNQLIVRKKESLCNHQRFLNVVLRKVSSASKLDLLAKPIREINLPHVLKSTKNSVRNKSEFTDRSAGTADELMNTTSDQKKELKYSYEKLNQKDEFQSDFKKLADQHNGSAEQKLYTESNFLAEERKTSEKDQESSLAGKRMPTNEFELPPPRRCRLSCPLPPPGFNPDVSNEYIPRRQSPRVKFSSQPDEFLLPKKQSKNTKYYSLEAINPPKPASTGTVPKTVKTKKKHQAKLNLLKPKTVPEPEVPKMTALLFEPTDLALRCKEVDAPTRIHKDEVVVQVLYSGVSGTDWSILQGKIPCGDNPIILGHEISGKVYASGSAVHHVTPGDNVAVNPYTSCGLCRYCTRGLFSSCLNEGPNDLIGVNKNGGWAEFIVLKRTQIHKLPEEVTLEQASLLQPLSCVLSAMSKLNITNGLDVMILGLGLAGCLWASLLHFKGYKNVFVCEKDKKKRQRFLSLNLGYPFVPPEDIGLYCADVIIESTGSPFYMEKALQILNSNGQICFFGKPSPTSEVRCLPYDIVKKEITIVGNAGNTFSFSEAIDLAAAMGDRYLQFDKLGIRAFNPEEHYHAFQQKKNGNVGKVMFKFDS